MHQWCSIRRITCRLPSHGCWISARVEQRWAGLDCAEGCRCELAPGGVATKTRERREVSGFMRYRWQPSRASSRLQGPEPTMKFDLAYCLSLDDKLSIYDVRDLNFDETVVFDSAKEHFQCPNDACRAAFDAANVLTTFNAKNVNYVRTPHRRSGCSVRVSRTWITLLFGKRRGWTTSNTRVRVIAAPHYRGVAG